MLGLQVADRVNDADQGHEDEGDRQSRNGDKLETQLAEHG